MSEVQKEAPRLSARASTIGFNDKQKTSYCIPIWLRDEQIKLAIARPGVGRIQGYEGSRPEPIAVVGFGPSLLQTWEKLRDFKFIMSTSGSHRFLIDRGIIPTYHVEVDPRAHKVKLLGAPHPDVTYLPASTCHPAYFDHLAGYKVVLWHIFSNEEDALRTLPREEWALMGGPDVGIRGLALARFFGHIDIHGFGIDGCAGPEDVTHALAHPNAPKRYFDVEYPEGSGKKFRTTPALLQCAKSIPHEIDQLKDCHVTFYGDTLVQEIMRGYVRKEKPAVVLGVVKPQVISNAYRELNAKLHVTNLAYGVGGGKHAKTVRDLKEKLQTRSILDYGCGKGYLAKALDFPIWEYDPAILEKAEQPRPADLVVCTDVLEHIEPDNLEAVLQDLHRVTRRIGFFVIHTGPSMKTLADGRNTHLIQQPMAWWRENLERYFHVAQMQPAGMELFCVVAAYKRKVKKSVVASAAASVAATTKSMSEAA